MTSGASSSTPISAAFDDFHSRIQVHALKATRHCLALPNDIAFHRSMDPDFEDDLDNFSSRVLSLANKVITLVAAADPSSSRAKGKTKLENQDDLLDNFHSLVVDSMDQLLERTVNNAESISLRCAHFTSGYMSRRISWLHQNSCHSCRPCSAGDANNKKGEATRNSSCESSLIPHSPLLAVTYIQLFNTRPIYRNPNCYSNGRWKTTTYLGFLHYPINLTRKSHLATSFMILM